MRADAGRYLRSLAAAALTQSRQVRDLIGSRHWLSDGRHKEALLQGVIRRHMPAGTLVCSGFVLHPTDLEICSREQDILVLDTANEAPLFQNDMLAVALPHTVLAAISVKTRLGSDELRDVLDSLNSVLDVASKGLVKPPIWCGGFFFEDHSNPLDSKAVARLIENAVSGVPVPSVNLAASDRPPQSGFTALATGGNLFVAAKYVAPVEHMELSIHECGDLAAALFIAHLIDHVATRRGVHEAGVVSFTDQALIGPAVITQRVSLAPST